MVFQTRGAAEPAERRALNSILAREDGMNQVRDKRSEFDGGGSSSCCTTTVNKPQLLIVLFLLLSNMPISATLKQKLSNLALSQSSPSSPVSSPTASSSPRRNVFNFARRGDKTTSEPIYDQGNTIDEATFDDIMQRVIRQAGVDHEFVLHFVIALRLPGLIIPTPCAELGQCQFTTGRQTFLK